MGTYLATGIIQDITIYKKDIRCQDIIINHMLDQLRKELNIDCYDYSEDANKHNWKIKPVMLEVGLVEFLDAQFQMYGNTKDKYMQETLAQLIKAKNGAEVIELAATKKLMNFQLFPLSIIHHIRAIRDNGFDEVITVYYSMISYFMDGKIIMECYNNIFRYFEHNIRLQSEKYPVVNCVKVMIAG